MMTEADLKMTEKNLQQRIKQSDDQLSQTRAKQNQEIASLREQELPQLRGELERILFQVQELEAKQDGLKQQMNLLEQVVGKIDRSAGTKRSNSTLANDLIGAAAVNELSKGRQSPPEQQKLETFRGEMIALFPPGSNRSFGLSIDGKEYALKFTQATKVPPGTSLGTDQNGNPVLSLYLDSRYRVVGRRTGKTTGPFEAIDVTDLSYAEPDPTLWHRLSTEVVAKCETDTTKPVRWAENGSLPPGTKLTSSNFFPDGYATGDMVASCKVSSSASKSMLVEFSRVPVSWNNSEMVFEFSFQDHLFQLSDLPLQQRLSIFRKVGQSSKKPDKP
jgi:hypothetical protein